MIWQNWSVLVGIWTYVSWYWHLSRTKISLIWTFVRNSAFLVCRLSRHSSAPIEIVNAVQPTEYAVLYLDRLVHSEHLPSGPYTLVLMSRSRMFLFLDKPGTTIWPVVTIWQQRHDCAGCIGLCCCLSKIFFQFSYGYSQNEIRPSS